MEFLFFMDVGFGILMILLAIPMVLQKVKPNMWYGFRTTKTQSDEGIWYAANQYAGKALLLAGIVTVVGSLVLYWVANSAAYGAVLTELQIDILWLILLVVPFAWVVIVSFVYLKSL